MCVLCAGVDVHCGCLHVCEAFLVSGVAGCHGLGLGVPRQMTVSINPPLFPKDLREGRRERDLSIGREK